jgi:hypothetical protein
MLSKYRYFGHRRRPEYRLVIVSGERFPPVLRADDWTPQEERPYDRVHPEVMKDVERQGFGFFKQYVRFEEIPRRRDWALAARGNGMSEFYCDYMHKHFPDFRMVLPKDAPMPPGGIAEDWLLVRTRPGDHMSVDGRKWVDEDGYALMRVHVPLAEIRAL